MKRNTHGFTLIDTLVAMMLVLTGAGAVVTLSQQAKRSWIFHRERVVAREVMGHIKHLPTHYLDVWKKQSFDALGRPAASKVKYVLAVDVEKGLFWKTYRCTLKFEDADGETRVLSFKRKEWLPYDLSQSL